MPESRSRCVGELIDEWWLGLDREVRTQFGVEASPDAQLLIAVLQRAELSVEADPADTLASALAEADQAPLIAVLESVRELLTIAWREIPGHRKQAEAAAKTILGQIEAVVSSLPNRRAKALVDSAVEKVPSAATWWVRVRLVEGDEQNTPFWPLVHQAVLTPTLYRATLTVWPVLAERARGSAATTAAFMPGAVLTPLRHDTDAEPLALHHALAHRLVELGLSRPAEPLPTPETSIKAWAAAAGDAVVAEVERLAVRFSIDCGLLTRDARLAFGLSSLLRLCWGHGKERWEQACLRLKLEAQLEKLAGFYPESWSSQEARQLFDGFARGVGLDAFLSPLVVSPLLAHSAAQVAVGEVDGELPEGPEDAPIELSEPEADGTAADVATKMIVQNCEWRRSMLAWSRRDGIDEGLVDAEQYRRVCSVLLRWELAENPGTVVSALRAARGALSSTHHAVQDVKRRERADPLGEDSDEAGVLVAEFDDDGSPEWDGVARLASYLKAASEQDWVAVALEIPEGLPEGLMARWADGARQMPGFMEWLIRESEMSDKVALWEDLRQLGVAATGKSTHYTQLQDHYARACGAAWFPSPSREDFSDEESYKTTRNLYSKRRERARKEHSPPEEHFRVFCAHILYCPTSDGHAVPSCAQRAGGA